ncbi:MAG: hypothetical protein WCG93_11140 [Paludibacter sp.]
MSYNTKSTGLILFLHIVITAAFNLSAQSNKFSPAILLNQMQPDGFVLLNNGDTLWGKVVQSWKYVENNPVEVQLIDYNRLKQIFKAADIKGFGTYTKLIKKDFDSPEVLDLEIYITVQLLKKGLAVFMKLLLDGTITVLENRSSISSSADLIENKSKIDGISFGIGRNKGLSIEPTTTDSYRIIEAKKRYSSLYVRKNKEPLIKLDAKNYESLFPTLFGDCPALNPALEKNPGLQEYKNFIVLAEMYNCICKSAIVTNQ